ncbi:hypothetical protein ACFQ51_08965 [Streptomyces kaempferi]
MDAWRMPARSATARVVVAAYPRVVNNSAAASSSSSRGDRPLSGRCVARGCPPVVRPRLPCVRSSHMTPVADRTPEESSKPRDQPCHHRPSPHRGHG